MLRHVVLFRWKDGVTADQVAEIEDAVRRLPDLIPEISEFEWGTDESVEGLAEGLSHCLLVTFAGAAERDVYLPHPDHRAFVDLVQPYLDRVVVFDYRPI